LKNLSRNDSKDFTRERILTFPRLILFFISLAKKSLQANLDEFLNLIKLESVTKQAFSKARKKLSAQAFILLNKKLIEEYYTDNEYSTWNSYRLISVDGSDIQLPQNDNLKEVYGAAKNQTGLNLGMARVSCAYDLLNHLTLDTQIDRYNTSERDLFVKHIEAIANSKDLYILDRGYPSFGLLFYLSEQKKDFLIRCSTSSFSQVKEVLCSGQEDKIIRLSAKRMRDHIAEIKKRVPNFDPKNAFIDIRVIILTLKTGEKEILITSLVDREKYPKEDFAPLYFRRWGIEENYKWHKQALELENFSGQSKLSIEQDLFSLILTANIATLIMREAQEELEREHKPRKLKHEYKVNKRLAISTLRDRLIVCLLDRKRNMESFCNSLKADFKKHLCPVRPNRSYKRPRKWRLKFSSTYRRCI
jgi:Transposase DDE domain